MAIITNLSALNAYRNLANVETGITRASQRLSSGLRINTAADDAAGLAISVKMRAKIRGIDQAFRNAQDAVSLIQVAEGGISGINDMLTPIRTLVVQAANDTNMHDLVDMINSDRRRIQDEINQLILEIDEHVRRIQFNKKILLDGRFARPSSTSTAFNGLMKHHQMMKSQHLKHVVGLYQTVSSAFNNTPTAKAPASAANAPAAAQNIQPTLSTPAIDLNNLVDGDSVAGLWSFNNGVLTIEGNGDFQINGNGVTSNRIVVNAGVTAGITLNNVNIDTSIGAALDMNGATVNLRLEGGTTNNLTSRAFGSAGIRTTGGTLTIDGTGELEARAAEWGGAGIGGGSNAFFTHGEDGGTIIINSGTIRAYGFGGAGIGGGAGISYGGSGGNIIINGGNVSAENERAGAGIGGGSGNQGGNGGNIQITGGTVSAVGGTFQRGAELEGGAGIGGGVSGGGGTITISGGIVTAVGGNRAASIGGGLNGDGADLQISGGLVEISTGQWIGGGESRENTGSTDVRGGNLSINPDNILNDLFHFNNNESAFRVRITLEDANGNPVLLGSHTSVTYSINGLTVNAITDSSGNLFMYLPIDFAGREGEMIFNGRTYRAELSMNPDHGNTLVLVRVDDNGNGGGTRPTERGGLHFQIGPNAGHSLFLHINAMDAVSLGLKNEAGDFLINVMQESGADISQLLDVLDIALKHTTRERSNLGAMQNRLEFTMRDLGIASENMSESESRIRDADMALEMIKLVGANVLRQAATAIFAQANAEPRSVLHLLQ